MGKFEQGNSGRPKGAVNKRTAAWKLAEEIGVNPLKDMLLTASREIDAYKRFSMMAELAPYLYAKLKQIDHKFDPQLAEQAEEFGTLDKDEQIRLLRLKADELERGT